MAIIPAINAIITITEYSALFGEIDSSTVDRIQTLINRASSRIELYIGRSVKSTNYAGDTALILDGKGRQIIVSPLYPITAINHLYLDGSRIFGPDSEINSSDFSVDVSSGIIKLHGTRKTPIGPGTIKLECTAGYPAASNEWQVLQQACSEIVKWMDGRAGVIGGIGMKSRMNADGMSETWETEIPLDIRLMLDQFRERQ